MCMYGVCLCVCMYVCVWRKRSDCLYCIVFNCTSHPPRPLPPRPVCVLLLCDTCWRNKLSSLPLSLEETQFEYALPPLINPKNYIVIQVP